MYSVSDIEGTDRNKNFINERNQKVQFKKNLEEKNKLH